MVAKKPPWSLKDQLFLIDQHWIAVYGQVLQQHVRGVSTQLLHTLRNRPGVMTVDEAVVFARRSMSLVQGFSGCKYCSDSIHSAISRLNLVTNRLQLMKQQPLLGGAGLLTGGAGSGGPHFPLQSPTTPNPHQPPVALVSPIGPQPITPLIPTTASNIQPDHPSSSLPLLTPSSSLSLRDKLTMVAQTPPTIPPRQLEWALGLVHDSIIYSQSLVQETLSSVQTPADRANVCHFVRQVVELLSHIVSSLQRFVVTFYLLSSLCLPPSFTHLSSPFLHLYPRLHSPLLP
ncbi:hypothetical protein GBAR_LOCUS4618 [Geodia barretti]|uniref:Uncharacterized protein n=1 Tax=Geodia barretti TaxID=519541 RepID=A0AA35R802_GEOBA|nr:hypothetical protein GBAR_LOCUS4618 [Geodia barretti]